MSSFRDHRIYLVPLLRALAGRGPTAPTDIYDRVADAASVTPEQRSERSERSERGTDNPVYRNRIQFARQALVDAGAVVGGADPRWQRGLWELTQDGEGLAKIHDDVELDAALRAKAAAGLKRRAAERQKSRELAGLADQTAPRDSDPDLLPKGARLDADDDDDDDDVEDAADLSDLVDEANERVLGAMLAHVRSMDDRAFEHLVAQVLRAALRAESVEVTQRSRDGGIDGLLYFDALKMRVAVFEAKRYDEANRISRPQIDAFATAARRRKAAHALFVTSSRFSSDAQDAAREEGIRAIDGTAFVELMALHGIGLRAKDTYVLYELDPAWSVSEAEA